MNTQICMPRLFLAGLALALVSQVIAAAEPEPGPGPADIVRGFNQAITSRNLDGAIALVAKGSVQFTLKPFHAGTPSPTGITTDLRTHWSTIGPVLFGTMSSYKRVPVIIDTRVEGDIATVWTRTTSESVDRKGSRHQEAFEEVYVLVREAAGWRIGSIADNRGTAKPAVMPN